VNNYGLSETTVVSTSGIIEPASDVALVPSIGKPIHNVDLHIVDAKLRPVPAGETGELLVGGVSVARGYVNLPDLSAERFPPDPFAKD
jgi:non-ribosomal peptide synthetase component F